MNDPQGGPEVFNAVFKEALFVGGKCMGLSDVPSFELRRDCEFDQWETMEKEWAAGFHLGLIGILMCLLFGIVSDFCLDSFNSFFSVNISWFLVLVYNPLWQAKGTTLSCNIHASSPEDVCRISEANSLTGGEPRRWADDGSLRDSRVCGNEQVLGRLLFM